MTLSTIRLDVVTLLCDTDFKFRPDTNRWSHLDGRPFTRAEHALAFNSTREEFKIAAARISNGGTFTPEYQGAVRALFKLLLPYLAVLPHASTIGDVIPLMSDEERRAYEMLGDLLDTDGYLHPPKGQ